MAISLRWRRDTRIAQPFDRAAVPRTEMTTIKMPIITLIWTHTSKTLWPLFHSTRIQSHNFLVVIQLSLVGAPLTPIYAFITKSRHIHWQWRIDNATTCTHVCTKCLRVSRSFLFDRTWLKRFIQTMMFIRSNYFRVGRQNSTFYDSHLAVFHPPYQQHLWNNLAIWIE